MVKLSKKCRAVLHTSMGVMTLDLLPDKAPRTVENFVKLAHKGFYDGTTFHRVLKDFMVQGGCPKGDGTGGPGYTIGPEFNDTPHVKGTVSMARSNDPHSGGSQFFIVHGDARYLDSKYSAFARLADGDEVLDKIAAVPVFENRWKELSQPRDAVYLNRIELEGVEFEAGEDGGQQQGGQQQQQQKGGQQGGQQQQGGPQGKGGNAPGQARQDAPQDKAPAADEAPNEPNEPDQPDDDGADEAEAPDEPKARRASGGKSAGKTSKSDTKSGGKAGAKGKSAASGAKSGAAKKAAPKKKSGSRSRANRED